jgi:hypothetical protein
VDHHRRIDPVEVTALEQPDRAATGLLRRGAEHREPPTELVGEGRQGDPGG